MSGTKGVAIAILCVLAVAAVWFATGDARAVAAALAPRTDLQSLAPGGRTTVPVGALELVVSVPEGECHTGGTFRAEVPQVDFESGALPRNGSLEAAWVDDVNEDGERALEGEWPVSSDPDHNASPSGKTRELGFDRATGGWREME